MLNTCIAGSYIVKCALQYLSSQARALNRENIIHICTVQPTIVKAQWVVRITEVYKFVDGDAIGTGYCDARR